MRERIMRLTALLLVFCLLCCLLTSCSDKSDKTDETGDSANVSDDAKNPESSTPTKEYAEFVYTAEYQELQMEGVSNFNQITVSGDRMYMIAWMITGKTTEYYDENWAPVTDEEAIANGEYAEMYEYDQTEMALCSMNLDGTGFQRLPNFQRLEAPEGSEGESYVNAFTVDTEGNLWICEELYAYHYDEEGTYYDDGTTYSIRKLDETGAELAQVDMTAIVADQEYFYVNSMVLDAAGMLYLTGGSESQVYVIDGTGKIAATIPVENWVSQMVRLQDGTVAAMVYEETGAVLRPIDSASASFGEGVVVPANAYSLLNGGGAYDFYYNNDISLFGFQADTGESTQLINWIDSDINSYELNNIIPLDDGRILGMTSNWEDGKSTYELVTLTKADPATLPEKILLTYACMWLDYDIRSKIIDFNKENDTYRINVVDYSVYNTDEDYEAGLTKLSTEIISGQVPDIIAATDSLPLQRYIARGLIEDLTPWIESDPELGPDALVPGAKNALSYKGGIYQAASTFYATTVVGPTSVVGEEPGWTMAELQAALQSCPPGTQAFANMTRDYMLQLVCMMNQENYVDWTTGECHFDNEEFINLLEFVKTFPVEISYENDEWVSDYRQIREGKVLLAQLTLADFQEFQLYDAVYGTDTTFIGFPTAEGNGTRAVISGGLAMSSTSAHKEGVWSFLRYLFTEEYQTSDDYWGWGFPTNQKAFDQVIEEAMKVEMTTDEEGNEVQVSVGTWWVDEGIEVEMYPPTQAQVDEVLAVLDGLGSAVSFDQDIYDIILEEAQYFFEGQKTAQDVASVIQSRVYIYINE